MTRARKKIITYPTALSISIGLSDGIILPFAFMAGLSPYFSGNNSLLAIGLFLSVGGAFLLALSGYFSIMDADDSQASREKLLKINNRILAKIDMEEYIGKEIENPEEAAEDARIRELQEALQQSGDQIRNPLKTALTIGFAFLSGGFLAMLPFLFNTPSAELALYGILYTAGLLGILGWLKSRFLNRSALELIFRLWLTTALATTGIYWLGNLFFSSAAAGI